MSQIAYTEDNLIDVSNHISRLKDLEKGLSGLKSNDVTVFKTSIIDILKKTKDANDERIHAILRHKQLMGESAEMVFAELKAHEAAKVCAEDLIEEINNTEKYTDQVSERILELNNSKKTIKDSIHNQDNA